MRNVAAVFMLGLILIVVIGCSTGGSVRPEAAANANAAAQARNTPTAAQQVPVYGYEVVNSWPHDAHAFTQGLIYRDGVLFESTGITGESSLRRVDLKTGKVLKKVDVPAQYFAEGITLLNGKIYQLTWRNKRGFIYEPETFNKIGEFPFDGEGWGLTDDGQNLILSDGTNEIRFIDPATFRILRSIKVYERNQPLRDLNELEYVKGEIYANIWHTDRIVRIDPQTGAILGWIDLKNLISADELSDEEAVLNGIAYDSAGDRLFVTGKLWPKLFEIRLKK